ncbi:MAG: hypothetical protein HN742_15975 [Lentisphaerae bacterium]|jgi:hypothetical protein|nr:hypothetical protein [Lentisphaerota bacterium]MBT5609003.1 hypothetical protein [Lentisphaerota bacterium]MBT7055820.1 hypothetical protein [Lentisphaerota bacterium]MBT7843375.1 hypothetical protein [Lentisphaerota bacterium]
MTDPAKHFVLFFALITASGCASRHGGDLRPSSGSPAGDLDPQFCFDDTRLLSTVCAPIKPVMPERLFTPVMQERIREGTAGARRFFSAVRDPVAGSRWLAVPEARWREMIVKHAPLTLTRCGGTCPFCGKRLSRVSCDMIQSPFVGQTACCKATVYGREADMPPDYPAIPNHVEVVPHLDGTDVEYRFHVPVGAESDRSRWFFPAGELWWARLNALVYSVIPDLTARVLLLDDAEAVEALTVILDSLAEVYPGMPFFALTRPVGLARCRDLIPGSDSSALITKATWDVELERRRRDPGTFATWDTAFFKLHYPYGHGSDGDLIPHGILAEGFAAIRHHPVFRRHSLALNGDAAAVGRRIATRLFDRISPYLRAKQPTLINMMGVYVNNAIKVAVVARDEAFLHKVAVLVDGFIYNHHFEDGLSTEGSFNYSAMMGTYVAHPWIARELLGIDFEAHYPIARRIRELGDFPVRTLLNVESMHGDEHGSFFTTLHGEPPSAIDYAAHGRSQNFPMYGLTCLRSGRPGARLEAVLDYQNQIMHGHSGRLNLQLFYEGLNLLPDIGYGTGNADPGRAPWKGLGSALPVVAPPRLAPSFEGHCTGAIDGRQFDRWTFGASRHIGGREETHPASMVQFVDVDGHHTYAGHPHRVDTFGRQLLTVRVAGRPVLVDVFRMAGGMRHDLFWHVPAAPPAVSVGAPRPLPHRDLYEWFEEHADPGPGWRKETEFLHNYVVNIRKRPFREELRQLTSPVEWEPRGGVWRSEWEITPERYAPVTPAGRDAYQPWGKLLSTTRLRLWAATNGTEGTATRLLGASAPWASNAEQKTVRGASRIGFKDGFSFLVEHRQGIEPGLRSAFVHVLEPFKPEQGSVLAAVDVPTNAGIGDIAVRLGGVGGQEVLVGSTLPGSTLTSPGLTLAGRLAVAWSESPSVVLYDGTHVATHDIEVDLEDSWKMTLLGMRGDITGHPAESALLVRSARPLPLGGVLAGHTITVQHRSAAAHVSMYVIDRVSSRAPGQYRLDLRDHPPFIQQKFHVVDQRGDDPSWLLTNMRLFAGVQRPHGLGRRVRFPRTGFETQVSEHRAEGYAGWWARWFRLRHRPGDGQVEAGDPMVIYSIAPGDTIVIPSHFACRGVTTEAQTTLDVFSTGAASLRLKAAYELVSADGEAEVCKDRGTLVRLSPGRTQVILRRP